MEEDLARLAEARPKVGVIVVGESSRRTRDVLQALGEMPDLIWPRTRGDLLLQLEGGHYCCLIIADDLAEEGAEDLLVLVHERYPALPVLVITDPDDVASAVAAMRNGATAAIEIPPSYTLLREHVNRSRQ